MVTNYILISSTGSLIVPLSADFTQANVYDNLIYPIITSSLPQGVLSSDRLQLINFYDSDFGQVIYSWRGMSIEPLIEHIKDVFKVDPLSIRGYQKAACITLLSVLLYQIIVYYNCKTRKEHPKAIKHTC